MKKNSGRGQIGDRDDELMRDLYYVRVASIPQIQRLYFPSYASARQRLYELGWMGLVQNNVYSRKEGLNLWMLTKRGFKRQAEDVGNPGERYRDWPTERHIRHYIETNELYVLLSGALDEILGEQPAWQWRDDARSSHNWKIGSHSGRHRPDAEIQIGNQLYFIERQTERSKEGKSYFEDKTKNYQGYIKYARAERGAEYCKVVWACDKEQHMDYALDAAKRHDVPARTCSTIDAWKYLISQAKETVEAVAQ